MSLNTSTGLASTKEQLHHRVNTRDIHEYDFILVYTQVLVNDRVIPVHRKKNQISD